MKRAQVTEYILIFKDDTELSKQYDGEYISENINDTDDIFDKYTDQISQYYSKRWILDGDDLKWKEDYVDIYYREA